VAGSLQNLLDAPECYDGCHDEIVVHRLAVS
jgi:hypothetical protein